MNVLHLTLKKKWFDLIASGDKKEEYREIKPYWKTRLEGKQFDVIEFRNGYSKNSPSMRVELKGIFRGHGIIAMGAPFGKPIYILKLGEVRVNEHRQDTESKKE